MSPRGSTRLTIGVSAYVCFAAKSGRLPWLPGRPDLWYLRKAARNRHQLGDPENESEGGNAMNVVNS